jgi:hypothetical protein
MKAHYTAQGATCHETTHGTAHMKAHFTVQGATCHETTWHGTHEGTLHSAGCDMP